MGDVEAGEEEKGEAGGGTEKMQRLAPTLPLLNLPCLTSSRVKSLTLQLQLPPKMTQNLPKRGTGAKSQKISTKMIKLPMATTKILAKTPKGVKGTMIRVNQMIILIKT